MNFPFFIAKRYLFSSKTKRAVNIISFVSMMGVIIGTSALVLLLSVFNGFEDLLLSMYNSFDPHIKITSNEGKTFNSENIISELEKNEDILYFTDVLEEKVLMKNGDHEFIASIKGVGEDFNKMTNLDSIIVEGENFNNYGNKNPCQNNSQNEEYSHCAFCKTPPAYDSETFKSLWPIEVCRHFCSHVSMIL